MDTSGTGLAFLVGFVVVFGAAFGSVAPLLEQAYGGRSPLGQLPLAGWVLWLSVAAPSLLQIPFPQVYDVLHRSASAVVDQHQWWRLVTSLTVQDGGIVGTATNLVLLGFALIACLRLWGTVPTVVTFVVGGVLLNVMAVAFGASDGGGNSGATLPLVTSLPAYALAVLLPGQRARAVAGCAMTATVAFVFFVVGDAHAIPIALGLVLGLLGRPLARRRWAEPAGRRAA